MTKSVLSLLLARFFEGGDFPSRRKAEEVPFSLLSATASFPSVLNWLEAVLLDASLIPDLFWRERTVLLRSWNKVAAAEGGALREIVGERYERSFSQFLRSVEEDAQKQRRWRGKRITRKKESCDEVGSVGRSIAAFLRFLGELPFVIFDLVSFVQRSAVFPFCTLFIFTLLSFNLFCCLVIAAFSSNTTCHNVRSSRRIYICSRFLFTRLCLEPLLFSSVVRFTECVFLPFYLFLFCFYCFYVSRLNGQASTSLVSAF